MHCRAALFAALAAFATPAFAQNYPTKPIRVILPVPPGSALDVVARLVAEPMGQNLGQAVVIEARPGGGGVIGAQAVLQAPPDGYTILGGPSSVFTILPAQKEKPQMNVNTAFTQIGLVIIAPLHIGVSPKLGINTYADFVVRARAEPQKLVVGTNGAGTLPHYTGLMLASKANVPVTVLPYNTGGTVEAVKDIMGGRVHATIEAYGGLRGFVKSGDLKIIAAMSEKREPPLETVPTVSETVPGLTSVGFMTLAAPAGTPTPIIERLNAALNFALAQPVVKQRLIEFGMPSRAMPPAQTTAYVDAEQKIWWPIVEASNAN